MRVKKDDINHFIILLKSHFRNGELKSKILPRLEDCSQGMVRVIMLLSVGASLDYIQKETGAGDNIIIKLMEDFGCIHGKFPDIYLMVPALQCDRNLLRDVMNMAIANNNMVFLKKLEQLTKMMENMNKASFLREEKKTTPQTLDVMDNVIEKEAPQPKMSLDVPKSPVSKEAMKFYKSLSTDIKRSLNDVYNYKGPEKFHTKGKGLEAYLKEKDGEDFDKNKI